jgi:hypothetical protein
MQNNDRKQQAEKLENDIMMSIHELKAQFDFRHSGDDYIFAISLGVHFGFSRCGNRVFVHYEHAFRGGESRTVKTAAEAMAFFEENGIV